MQSSIGENKLTILLYCLSFLVFIALFWVESIFLIIVFYTLTLPFQLFLSMFIHEIGHALGCLYKKQKIISIKIMSFILINQKIKIAKTNIFKSNCLFVKKEKNSIIFLMGILSTLFFLIVLMSLIYFLKLEEFIILFIINFIILLVNILPFPKSDIRMIFKEKS